MKRQQGNVMLISVLLMMILSALLGIVLTQTGTVARNTNRSRNFLQAQVAAEGAVDYAFGIWVKRVQNKRGKVSAAEANMGLTGPSFPGVVYAPDGALKITPLDTYGVPLSTDTAVQTKADGLVGKVPGYSGWYGTTYTYAATAKMQPSPGGANSYTAGVRRIFQYTQVPLFQTMFFFQDTLELYNPAPIVVSGLMHSNTIMNFGTQDGSFTIQGQASYVDKYYEAIVPKGMITTTPAYLEAPYAPSWNNGGKSVQLHQVTPIQPLGDSPESVFAVDNANTSNDFHELIEPPVSGIADPVSDRRLYNKAGLIIKVNGPAISGSTVTVTGQNGTTVSAATKNSIVAALSKVQGSVTTTKKGSTTTTVVTGIYDQREDKSVDVVTLDVGKFNTAISGLTFNGVLYIYDDTPQASGDMEPKTIRLQNGTVLPSTGLTVASVNPVYVQGDYNTGTPSGTTTIPSNGTGNNANKNNDKIPHTSNYTPVSASVIADAVMLLSNSWKDDQSYDSSISKRKAGNTTYNTAILSGYMPTLVGYNNGDSLYTKDKDGNLVKVGKDKQIDAALPVYFSNGTEAEPYYKNSKSKNNLISYVTGKEIADSSKGAYVTSSTYSGGAINYPRFLEDWSSVYCTYFGSMVELYRSRTFTGAWGQGSIYLPPNRCWNFDTMFLSNPPPGSVDAIVLSRGPWSKF